MSTLRLGGVVPAAGFSSRMGTCKALLGVGDRCALRRNVDLLRSAGVEEPVVVTGCYREIVEEEALVCGARAVFNEGYEDGMFSSIRKGVEALPYDLDAFFLLPVDIPMVRGATCVALAGVFINGVDIVYPAFRGLRGHPPLIGAALVPEILAWNGEGGLRALLEKHAERSAVVDVPDQGVAMDMDTPDDYRMLNELAAREYVPSETECLAFHEMLGSPPKVLAHCLATAKVARELGETLSPAGGVDPLLLHRAALVHDIARTRPRHAEAAGDILEQWGFPSLAGPVRVHMDIPQREPLLSNASLLYLADKLTSGAEIMSLESRKQEMRERFAGDREALDAALYRLARAGEIAQAFRNETGRSAEDLAVSALQ